MEARTTPTTFKTWMKAFEVLNSSKKPFLIKIGLINFFFPFMIMVVFNSIIATPMVNRIWSGPLEHYEGLLNLFYHFWSSTFLVMFATLFFCISGYIAMIKIACSYYRDEEEDLKDVLIFSFRKVLPQGLLIFFFTLLMSLESLFFGAFRMFSLFAIMAVVVMVNENKGALSSLKRAMFFKYSSPIYGGGFTAAFVLIGLGALVFACEYSLSFLSDFLMHADEMIHVPRGMWTVTFPYLPFGPIYLCVSSLVAAGYSAIVAIVATYTVSLYYSVHSQINHSI